jgi:pimeloyl-ACP methyl ester carboxylesterase
VGAVVTLDTPLRRAEPENLRRRHRLAHQPTKTYAALDEAIAEYRPRPAAAASADVIAHIARSAYRLSSEGWTHKYDPRIYLRPQVSEDYLQPARVPTCWIRAEHGLIDATMAATIHARLGPLGTFAEVSRAGHHILLEYPVATAWVIDLFCASIEPTHLQR